MNVESFFFKRREFCRLALVGLVMSTLGQLGCSPVEKENISEIYDELSVKQEPGKSMYNGEDARVLKVEDGNTTIAYIYIVQGPHGYGNTKKDIYVVPTEAITNNFILNGYYSDFGDDGSDQFIDKNQPVTWFEDSNAKSLRFRARFPEEVKPLE